MLKLRIWQAEVSCAPDSISANSDLTTQGGRVEITEEAEEYAYFRYSHVSQLVDVKAGGVRFSSAALPDNENVARTVLEEVEKRSGPTN